MDDLGGMDHRACLAVQDRKGPQCSLLRLLLLSLLGPAQSLSPLRITGALHTQAKFSLCCWCRL